MKFQRRRSPWVPFPSSYFKVHIRHVYIMDDCTELILERLNFFKGVMGSEFSSELLSGYSAAGPGLARVHVDFAEKYIEKSAELSR